MALRKFSLTTSRKLLTRFKITALLTTTMTVMNDVIHGLENQGIRKGVKAIVGGAPISRAFAREIGADYYFENAFVV